MIKVTCHTNLDGYAHSEWPRQTVALPRVGDFIQSSSGKKLQIVQVTHCYDPSEGAYISLELHR